MTRRQKHLLVRRSHRYLGVIFGIQFFFWTAGGVYFSWSDLDHIRGEDIRKEERAIMPDSSMASVAEIMRNIKKQHVVEYVKSVQLSNVLNTLCYQITYKDGKRFITQLADAQTGKLRPPLSEKEAIEVAESSLNRKATIKDVTYLTNTNDHHEYRDKALPAYAVTFSGDVNSTVYVSTEQGTVQSFRNYSWRLFDFLWMLHTMDFKSRDNINNWLLRFISGLGLVTIFSGFILYAVSFKSPKQKIA
jgi:uncharacterized iron-regulated membrane protein